MKYLDKYPNCIGCPVKKWCGTMISCLRLCKSYQDNKEETKMTSYRTNKEIIEEFCERELSTHTDWTGTRVETKHKCESVEEFVDKLMTWIEDNHYKC